MTKPIQKSFPPSYLHLIYGEIEKKNVEHISNQVSLIAYSEMECILHEYLFNFGIEDFRARKIEITTETETTKTQINNFWTLRHKGKNLNFQDKKRPARFSVVEASCSANVVDFWKNAGFTQKAYLCKKGKFFNCQDGIHVFIFQMWEDEKLLDKWICEVSTVSPNNDINLTQIFDNINVKDLINFENPKIDLI
ncbi:mediator of RNA polymerase ii transcription subunit 18 [Anaeramoeba ignava]|uniref:Mediator of RNA polymerase ii transcription subunit 18 n=1 Tax=Anaeramoeba ignava TaxID=1746090 RepID=A0A9Q0L8Y9_ANAIG|nr:mediator of RNA polymerase ii transcription subunit 18 [Anaeramoeba ignava]